MPQPSASYLPCWVMLGWTVVSGQVVNPERPTLPLAGPPIASAETPLIPKVADELLEVRPQGRLASFWKVHDALLHENFQSTWANVEVENASPVRIEGARFYGDYFDAAGRICFSAAFSQDENDQGLTGAFAPGERRTLISLGSSLAPASEPKELRLYLIAQRLVGSKQEDVFERERLLRVPPTNGGYSVATQTVRLPGGLMDHSPIVDLALARVTVDEHGHAQQIEILQASPSVSELCRAFFGELRFEPASSGDLAESGTALVLLRAVDYRRKDLESAPFRSGDSPWVQAFVARLQGTEVPTITELLFAAARGEPKLFVFASAGSEWSSNIFHFATNPRTGRCCHREWGSTMARLRGRP